MKLKPNFIRTIDYKTFENAHFDVNVMFISSRKPVDGQVSIIVVDGIEHHVFTSELKEFVSLPNSRLLS
jgi:hypothetical protein